MLKVLALTRYGPLAASTRQRFLQYAPALAAAGIELTAEPLMDDEHMRRLVRGQRASPLGVARAYLRRTWALLRAARYDLLWLHCESFPYLPGQLELLARWAKRPIIYDYDDAIFHIYDASRRSFVRQVLGTKLQPLLSRSAACTCGNGYLADYAGRFCRRTLIVATVVDTDRYIPRPKPVDAPLVIGWIGSPSTWPQVRFLLPSLERLCATHGVRFRVVGAGRLAEADRFDGMELVDWSEEREIELVQAMDIGIMPLVDSPFVRGKSGYKLIQYMACGLPTVASPIGVNREIVGEAETGFLADSLDDWERALTRLLGDAALRRQMGAAGRVKAVASYSLASQAPRLVALFRDIASEGRGARARA